MQERGKRPADRLKQAVIVAAALIALVSIILLAPSKSISGQAQSNGRYYPVSGHTVDPIFLEYFDEHGAVGTFGYPLTEAFVEPTSGQVVQYFENMRLEVGSDNEGAFQVMPSALGVLLGNADPPLPQGRQDAGCRFYIQTGHQVCYTFISFYDGMGGPELFGYPVSELRMEGDLLVQTFQNAQLEWTSELEQVRLTPLGRTHFEEVGYPIELLLPRAAASQPEQALVEELQVKTSVSRSVLQSDGVQNIYVLVLDQDGRPVKGAAVMMIAQFHKGERTIIMPSTDAEGRSQFHLNYEEEPPGSTVSLEFWIVYGELRRMTRDSFLVWW